MQISEVIHRYKVSKQTLYYWERIGLLNNISRDMNGYRNYSKDNLKQIEFINCMRKAKMTINKLQKYMYLYNSDDPTYKQRKDLISEQLDDIKSQILNYKNAQKMLEYKLNHYEEIDNELNKKDAE